MGKPIHLERHKLGDKIVKDAIIGVNIFKDSSSLKGRIAGGIAVQAYLDPCFHRGTIDLDFSLDWQGNNTSFKELCLPVFDYLSKEGYSYEFQNKSFSRDLIFYEPFPGGDSYMIQHPNRSKKYFQSLKKSLEREISNQKFFNLGEVSFGVLSPEDLVIGKANRVLVFMEKYGISLPQEKTLDGLRTKSRIIREEVLSQFPEISPDEVARLRLINDCYDIKSLGENILLDPNYLKEVCLDWRSCRTDQRQFYWILDKLEINT